MRQPPKSCKIFQKKRIVKYHKHKIFQLKKIVKIHNRPCTFGYKKRKSIQTNVKSVKRLKFEDPPTTPCSNHSVEDSTENLKWVTNGNFSLKSSHKDIIQNGEKLDCDIINF